MTPLREQMVRLVATHFDDKFSYDFSNPYVVTEQQVDAEEQAGWVVDEIYDLVYAHIRDAIAPLADEFNLTGSHLYRD